MTSFSAAVFIVFAICTLLVAYSYVIFPILLKILSAGKKMNAEIWFAGEDLPGVSVIIAAYNEERVISEKLKSLLKTTYPADRLEILVGSDASSDNTETLIREIAAQDKRVRLFPFRARRGKPSLVNDLVREARYPIIVLTDANVMLKPETLYRMIRHFRSAKIGLVGANIVNIGQRNDGISKQETSYIARENLIKYREGIVWGTMMGPFGGCFALRKQLFREIPAGFLVDDFFICMQVIQNAYLAINELDAICYEDVSNDIRQEYRRKARISAGNFQNLRTFSSLLRKPFSAAGFTFISHKVLRWLTPFFLLISFVCLFFLSFQHPYFKYLFFLEILLFLSPLIDFLFKKAGMNLKLLRFIAYFSFMNLALMIGFFRYLKGVKSSVWTPTKREV